MGGSLYSLLLYMFEPFHIKRGFKDRQRISMEREKKKNRETDMGIKEKKVWKVALLYL